MMRDSAWTRATACVRGAALAFSVCVLCSAVPASAGSAPVFRHGINITRLFDSATGRKVPGLAAIYAPWTHEISQGQLQSLRAAGFDFIRLPVDPGPLLSADPDRRREAFDQISDFLAAAMQAGLAVIVDLHPLPQSRNWSPVRILDAPDGPDFTRYMNLAEQFATRLSALRSNRVALELMNEPQRACIEQSGTDWSVFQSTLYSALRKTAPDLALIVTGGCDSSINGLADLNGWRTDDKNIFVMVHFYEPFVFTHQGAAWSPYAKYLAGVRYPARTGDRDATEGATKAWIARLGLNGSASDTAWDRAQHELEAFFATPFTQAALSERFDIAAQWADRMHIPRDHIIIGEFGVMSEGGGLGTSPEAMAARDEWLHDVASAAARRGFGWAVWGYHGAFGITSETPSRALDPDALRALFGH